jgi:hypothetical protein
MNEDINQAINEFHDADEQANSKMIEGKGLSPETIISIIHDYQDKIECEGAYYEVSMSNVDRERDIVNKLKLELKRQLNTFNYK